MSDSKSLECLFKVRKVIFSIENIFKSTQKRTERCSVNATVMYDPMVTTRKRYSSHASSDSPKV